VKAATLLEYSMKRNVEADEECTLTELEYSSHIKRLDIVYRNELKAAGGRGVMSRVKVDRMRKILAIRNRGLMDVEGAASLLLACAATCENGLLRFGLRHQALDPATR
jgi:hypothetical protein